MIEASQLVAHGLGGQTNLPIPFEYAVIGATWALTISFAVLAFAWKEPKLGTGESDLPPARNRWLGAVGVVVTLYVYGALWFGNDQVQYGAIGFFYTLLWVGLVPLALLAGHVWRDLSPWRTFQAVVGRVSGRPDGFVAYPTWAGYLPAAAGLFAFVWLELVYPDAGNPVAIGWWLGSYAVLMIAGGVVFGPRWFDRADPFDVYSAIVAKLSPFVRDGRWGLHNPLRTLGSIPIDRGLVALIAVLLGSTAFDSFGASLTWQQVQPTVWLNTLMLAVFVAVVAVLFWGAAAATGGLGWEQRRKLPGDLAHSLVPIIVGYIFAHYLTYLVEQGQRALINLAGLDWTPWFGLSRNPTLLATLTVIFVVIGHVIAVIAAHDRALVVLPKSHRLSGQIAMLIVMVAFTMTGLYLLFTI